MADSIRNFIARFIADNSSLTKGAAQVDTALDKTAKNAQDAETKVRKASSGISTAFASFGAGLGAGLGAGALLDFGKDSLRAASDAQQAMGGIEAVFKDSADAVKGYAAGAAEAVGLSRSQYGQLATVLGSQLKGMGQSTGEAAKGSDQLIRLGSDLAATYGGSVGDAVNAVSSLLKGERDPIEKYGVSLKQADVDAQMAAMGMKGLTGPAKTAGEAQATLALLFGKTADAQGGFAREAGQAANEAEKQAAKTENLKAAIGDKLLPAYQGLLGFINDSLLPGLDTVLQWFKNFGDWINTNSTLLASLGATFGVIAVGLTAIGIQQEIIAAGGLISWVTKVAEGTKLWAAAQWLLNAAMDANPIGLIIIGVAALAAALVLLWNNSETFRDIVTGAWDAVKNAASTAWDWIWSNAIEPLITAYQWVKDAAGAVGSALSDAWTTIITAASTAWTWLWDNVFTPFINAWNAVMAPAQATADFFGAWGDAIMAKLGAVATWLWDHVFTLLTNAFQWLADKAGTVFAWITAVWDAGAAAAAAAWQWMWDNAISPLITAFQWLADKAGAVMAWLGGVWNAITTAAVGAYQAIYTFAIQPLVAAFDWVVTKVTEFKDAFVAGLGSLRDGAVGVFDNMRERIGQVWDGVKELAKVPIRFIVETVINKGLIGTYNTIAGWFPGAPHLDDIHLPEGFASGGRVPGRSPNATADNIPIWATAGEYMMPVSAVNHYGQAFMEAIRSRRYAAGGMVAPVPGPHAPWGSYPGHTGLDFPVGRGTPVVAALDGIVNAVRQMTTSYGIHVRVSSADGIEAIYAHLESASVAAGQILKAGDQLGLSDSTGHSTGDHLHFELRQNGQPFDPTAMLNGAAQPPGGGGGFLQNVLRPLVEKVKNVANEWIDKIPGGIFGEIVKGIARKALDVVAGWLGAAADKAPTDNTGNPGAPGGAGAQQWASVAAQALEMAGESQSLLPLLLHRIDVESGGNPNAINNWDSNAKAGHPSQGLMQTIPSTFNAYAGIFAGRGITDPLANIFAAIMYTRAQYHGDFARAWGGTHGYAHGGLVALAGGGVVRRPTVALVGESGPEAVVPLGAGLGGNRTYNINVTVQAGAPAAEVGRAVVENIRAFERAAGAGWRAA